MACKHAVLMFLAAAGCALAEPEAQRPSYYPPTPQTYGTPDRNCSIDFVHSEASVCVPALKTECETEEITVKTPIEEEKCVQVSTTSCRAEVKSEDVETCFYVYERKDTEARAKVADVKYEKQCDTKYVEQCNYRVVYPAQSYGGYGAQPETKQECKEVPQETCVNEPSTESRDTPVTVSIPQPVRKCTTKRVQTPDVICETTREERCFPITRLQEETKEIEKCVTSLTDPRCTKAILNLPQQTCTENLKDAPSTTTYEPDTTTSYQAEEKKTTFY